MVEDNKLEIPLIFWTTQFLFFILEILLIAVDSFDFFFLISYPQPGILN